MQSPEYENIPKGLLIQFIINNLFDWNSFYVMYSANTSSYSKSNDVNYIDVKAKKKRSKWKGLHKIEKKKFASECKCFFITTVCLILGTELGLVGVPSERPLKREWVAGKPFVWWNITKSQYISNQMCHE